MNWYSYWAILRLGFSTSREWSVANTSTILPGSRRSFKLWKSMAQATRMTSTREITGSGTTNLTDNLPSASSGIFRKCTPSRSNSWEMLTYLNLPDILDRIPKCSWSKWSWCLDSSVNNLVACNKSKRTKTSPIKMKISLLCLRVIWLWWHVATGVYHKGLKRSGSVDCSERVGLFQCSSRLKRRRKFRKVVLLWDQCSRRKWSSCNLKQHQDPHVHQLLLIKLRVNQCRIESPFSKTRKNCNRYF